MLVKIIKLIYIYVRIDLTQEVDKVLSDTLCENLSVDEENIFFLQYLLYGLNICQLNLHALLCYFFSTHLEMANGEIFDLRHYLRE